MAARRWTVAVVLAFALAACGSDEPSGGGPTPSEGGRTGGDTSNVDVKNLAYSPAELTVTAGTVVTWTNRESLAHTVTSGDPDDGPSGEFDVPIETEGATATHQFKKAGSFPYYCKVHPQMTGTVTVT